MTAPHIGGKFAENIMYFARLLRQAGLPLGPGQVIDAISNVEAVGLFRMDDVYWALHAAFVKRRNEQALFDEAFHLFFRDPFGRNDALALLLPQARVPEDAQRSSMSRRLMEAWRPPPPERMPSAPTSTEERFDLDMTMTYSDVEVFRAKDFEEMSSDEVARARHLIARMRFAHLTVRTRRLRATNRGPRLDLRRMLRASMRAGGRDIPLRFRGPRPRPPPLVAICDISGSMERYSRMVLVFLHALTSDRDRVHSFVFGTRLTNVSRWLRHRDVDHALRKVGEEVRDWSGGTRIGQCLSEFNQNWSRRVLGQGAIVLLITDGLDRDPSVDLSKEAERLAKSCRRLVWLNPLLRFDGFEPRAAGIQALLPWVDDFLSIHNLESLDQLVEALERPPGSRTWKR